MARILGRRFSRWLPFAWRSGPLVPVVRLSGVIGYVTPLSPGLTLAGVARTLERAFAIKRAKAVAVIINSPGGSAVQSHLIYSRIRELAEQHKKTVIAFVEDVAASGGYMIACAADEIVADPHSIVGSIGVVSAGFGFDKAIKKLGIERRVYTAGERKVILDPFKPERAGDVRHLKALQKEIHAGFIDLVKQGRGKRLKGGDKTLFSGEFWIAGTARKLGLVDELGDVRSFLRARYGKKVATPLVAPSQSWFTRRTPGVAAEPTAWAAGVLSAIEARALWARFGL
jgi:signal peptide peptidase SppA